MNRTPQPSSLPPTPPTRRPAPSSLRGLGLRGFTILEVAMASFVMLLGIASSIIAMQSGFQQIDVSRGTTIASQIIQSEMERLRMMPWNKTSPASTVDSISELPASEVFDGAAYFSANPAIAGKFTITRTVGDDPGRSGDVRNITVIVKWKSYDNREHQRRFTAIYVRNGLYDYYYTVAHP